jgi:exopolysaccharide production protein ExoQ
MPSGRSAFSSRQSKYAPNVAARFAGLISGQAKRPLAVWFEAGIDTAALLFFPLLVLVPRGVAALASAAGLCAAALVLLARGFEPRPLFGRTAAVLACLLVWATVSVLWSADPWGSLALAARLAGILAAGLALVAAVGCIVAPRRLILSLLAGLVVGIAMVAVELATHDALGALVSERAYQAARLNQASVSFAILLAPASAMLVYRGHAVFALVIATATTAAIFTLSGTSAKAAVAAGLVLGLLLYLGRARAAYAAAVISLILIITAPLSFARLERFPGLTETADRIKISAGHRLMIWSFAGERIAERPLAGWGLDAARAIPGGMDPIRPGETWLPLHPHNAPLQVWLELGVPGAVLFALLVALPWYGLATVPWPRMFTAAAGTSLAIALIASFATYGIWQEWWVATLWFLLFAVLVMARLPPRRPRYDTTTLLARSPR